MANPKGNTKNLKPQNKRTKEEQRKIARKGKRRSLSSLRLVFQT